MAKVVTQGAGIECDQGQMANLIVTSQNVVKVGGLPVATIADFEPLTNIPPMWICNLQTADAGQPMPCLPNIESEWEPGSSIQTIKTVDGQQLPVLLDNCKLSCDLGPLGMGKITVLVPTPIEEPTLSDKGP